MDLPGGGCTGRCRLRRLFPDRLSFLARRHGPEQLDRNLLCGCYGRQRYGISGARKAVRPLRLCNPDSANAGIGVVRTSGLPRRFLADSRRRRNLGLGMGVHESIIPAAVTPMVSPRRRTSAFGIFTAGYGVFWFIGSAVIGMLYDRSLVAVIAFCVCTQLLAVRSLPGSANVRAQAS